MNTVGGSKDKVECIFCGKIFAALAIRIRAHCSGDKSIAEVNPCPGPSRRPAVGEEPEESDDAFEARKEQFEAVKSGLKAQIAKVLENVRSGGPVSRCTSAKLVFMKWVWTD